MCSTKHALRIHIIMHLTKTVSGSKQSKNHIVMQLMIFMTLLRRMDFNPLVVSYTNVLASVCYRAVTQWFVVYSIKQDSLNQD